MNAIRKIDRKPSGNPLFCEVTAYKADTKLGKMRMVYSDADTDEYLIRKMNLKQKPTLFEIKLLIEWIDNKPISYD